MAVINFVEELRWRGLLQDSTPGAEAHLMKGPASGYIGFDPTADSAARGQLGADHDPGPLPALRPQARRVGGRRHGHGGRSQRQKSERNLLDEDALRHNQACVKAQLERFLDFNSTTNPAQLGEQLRLVQGHGLPALHPRSGQAHHRELHDGQGQREEPHGDGISFTEFSYQLVQGYDFGG
jgi:tyrosyl-tRNA synthetase